MAKMTYTRAEVTAILVELEADGRELYDIFTAPLCKECGQKKGPCPDGSPCWLDELTVDTLAEKWLDRREAAADVERGEYDVGR